MWFVCLEGHPAGKISAAKVLFWNMQRLYFIKIVPIGD